MFGQETECNTNHRMPSADSEQPLSARPLINAHRKRHAIIEAIYLVGSVVGVWYAVVVLEYHGECVFLVVFGFMFLSFIQNRSDVCPSCRRSISMLPSEGHFRVPELSHAIRCCPYCAADFSLPTSPDSDRTVLSASASNLSYPTEQSH
jgi:hypothetical protein